MITADALRTMKSKMNSYQYMVKMFKSISCTINAVRTMKSKMNSYRDVG